MAKSTQSTTQTWSKNPALDEALKNIEKQFGKWSIMRMGDTGNLGQVTTFHSGSYVLDLVVWWWYPEGRVIEMYGPESSGKTTIALQAIAAVQAKWEIAAFIDAEHAFDPNYARKIGVDVDNLLFSQPSDGEQALQIVEELGKTWAVRLIVVDSVAALVPRAEVEGDMGDSFMWLQARMMSQGLRKITSVLAKTGTTCIFINQIRMKIGVMFGNPETTTGGQALKFFSSLRLEIRKGEKIMVDKDQVGYFAKITVVKNKIAAPYKKVELAIKWNQGVVKSVDIIEAATLLGLISKSWAFYTIWDQKFQGRERLEVTIETDEKLRNKLEKEIQEKIKAMRSWEKVLDETALHIAIPDWE